MSNEANIQLLKCTVASFLRLKPANATKCGSMRLVLDFFSNSALVKHESRLLN
jgi:hypothetical protein